MISRGHVIRRKIRDAHGRFIGYETLVFEEPHACMTTEMPFTDVGKTDIRKRHTNNTNKRNTNFNNTTTKSEEKSSYFYPRTQGGPEADKIVNDVLCRQYRAKDHRTIIFSREKRQLIIACLNLRSEEVR